MLSCYLIVKNGSGSLNQTLASVKNLASEIVVIDDGSTDSTQEIAKKHGAKVISFINPSEGAKRHFAVDHCKGDWILCLDADEVVSEELAREIETAIRSSQYHGYLIPFRNHFLGKEVKYGGESYSQLRLFQKKYSKVENTPIHAFHIVTSGKTGTLKHKLDHYSYRSLVQLYRKFTDYAFREAKRKKANSEKTGLKQITMYPIHMFYARFIEDKGYKDGLFRIPLDLGFAYMEWLTYMVMFFI